MCIHKYFRFSNLMKKIKDYSQMLDVVTTKWQKVNKNISTIEIFIEK